MTLTQYALTLALGFSSVGIATAQEHSTIADPSSHQTFEKLTQRAELFEAKAQLATQCAKGLRLVQQVMNLASPDEEREYADWFRETYWLVRMWFSKEKQDEWYFAGKEFADYVGTWAKEDHTKEEAVEMYKRMFAVIVNAQVTVMNKLSDDLDTRMNRIVEARSAD